MVNCWLTNCRPLYIYKMMTNRCGRVIVLINILSSMIGRSCRAAQPYDWVLNAREQQKDDDRNAFNWLYEDGNYGDETDLTPRPPVRNNDDDDVYAVEMAVFLEKLNTLRRNAVRGRRRRRPYRPVPLTPSYGKRKKKKGEVWRGAQWRTT